MKTFINRLVGLLLVLAALVGLAFSIAGISTIWRIKPVVTTNLVSGVKLAGSAMDTTAQGLVVTQQALKSSVDSIVALQATIDSTAETLGATRPMIEVIARLMEDDLPQTIRATQASLDTAQSSARVIDSVLTAISKIPLIGPPYDPEIPLDQALGLVSESLEDLPAKFTAIQTSLEDTGDNLEVMQADIETVAVTIQEIQGSVAQYDQVIGDYQKSLAQVQEQLGRLAKKAPETMDGLAWALTVFLGWMAIAQLGLLTQGWELMTRRLIA